MTSQLPITPVQHVNPNCKDASLCEPHGEFGPVTHRTTPEERQSCNCLCHFDKLPTPEEYAVSSYYGCSHCRTTPVENKDAIHRIYQKMGGDFDIISPKGIQLRNQILDIAILDELAQKDTECERRVEERDNQWLEALGEVEYCSVKFNDDEVGRQLCLGRNALRGIVAIKMNLEIKSESLTQQKEE